MKTSLRWLQRRFGLRRMEIVERRLKFLPYVGIQSCGIYVEYEIYDVCVRPMGILNSITDDVYHQMRIVE